MSSPTDLSNLKLWCDADRGRFDATSGGSSVTADNAPIASWLPDSGGTVTARLTQATSATRPFYDATRGLVVSLNRGAADDNWFVPPASFTLDRRAFSFFAVAELGSLWDGYRYFASPNGFGPFLGFDGGFAGDTGKLRFQDGGIEVGASARVVTHQRSLIGWIGSATDFKVVIDGTVYSAGSPLASGSTTLDALLGLNGFTAPSGAAVKDLIIYDRALTNGEVTGTVWAYAQSRGVSATRQGQLVITGDSITHGKTNILNRSWPQVMSLNDTVRRRVFAESGILLTSIASRYAVEIAPVLVGGEQNALVIFAGTNDISGGASDATLYNSYQGLAAAAKADGFYVVAVTMLPRTLFDGTQQGYRTAYNTRLANGVGTDTDALVDLRPVEGSITLTDGIHPDEAGRDVIAAAVATVVQPLFTTNPTPGTPTLVITAFAPLLNQTLSPQPPALATAAFAPVANISYNLSPAAAPLSTVATRPTVRRSNDPKANASLPLLGV